MVQNLAVFDGQLYAGGVFLEIGGERVNNLARWDGSDWHALGKGLTGADLSGVPMVNSLVVGSGS